MLAPLKPFMNLSYFDLSLFIFDLFEAFIKSNISTSKKFNPINAINS